MRLIDALDKVRNAIGGHWGIYTTLQDFAGDYISVGNDVPMT